MKTKFSIILILSFTLLFGVLSIANADSFSIERKLLHKEARTGSMEYNSTTALGNVFKKDKNWVFHPEHGYLYFHVLSSNKIVYFYDPGYDGWFFTTKKLYQKNSQAKLFDFKRKSWVNYHRGSGSAEQAVAREFTEIKEQKDYKLQVNYGNAYPGFDYESHYYKFTEINVG